MEEKVVTIDNNNTGNHKQRPGKLTIDNNNTDNHNEQNSVHSFAEQLQNNILDKFQGQNRGTTKRCSH